MQNVLVTGGCGFIGTNFIQYLLQLPEFSGRVVNIDKLSYAGTRQNLETFERDLPERYRFIQIDICNGPQVEKLLTDAHIDTIVHMAAESHVDRSIDSSAPFIETNVGGTHALLEAARRYLSHSPPDHPFRFLHVSTDEVFGALGPEGTFTEDSPYAPNSPYAASKAGSDLLVRAWGQTYGLPVLTTNCSNNYGPYQFPEKLIPVVILSALRRQPVPVYGQGTNVRDWLYVGDHASALYTVATRAEPGARYNIGGDCERTNIDLVTALLKILSEKLSDGFDYTSLISFVKDRPGHDLRYAVDATRLANELGWKPTMPIEDGLRKTVDWYLENRAWWESLLGTTDGSLERRGQLGSPQAGAEGGAPAQATNAASSSRGVLGAGVIPSMTREQA
ncbi:MAG: dTDP-glucose 4,6-dehydratase [Opitutales bacterium]